MTGTNTPGQGQLKMSSEEYLFPSTPSAQPSPPHIVAVKSSDVHSRAQFAGLGVGPNTVYHNFGFGGFQYPLRPWSQTLSETMLPMDPWSQEENWTFRARGRYHFLQNQA